MLLRQNINIRDPFVLPVKEESLYYMFGTTASDGFDVYVSSDLEAWEGPFPAFRTSESFWADRDFWAPEVHAYLGKYYLLASMKAEGLCRATQVFVADHPKGPFVPHSKGPVTPAKWECLDGTLFIDEEGMPWMVFCHEWLQVQDGEMCAVRLTKDLSAAVGEPILLFRASEAPWAVSVRNPGEYVTDGPWLYRNGGELRMLWSSFGKEGYATGVARSASGRIAGPWRQDAEPYFAKDGGHGMLFATFAGDRQLSIHQPNISPSERPIFIRTDREL
jgi:arabinan endo-1,5-alpha-L-arabinosidase